MHQSLIVDDFEKPNWLAFSADESLLYVDVPEVAANRVWGDEDWETLYITGSTSL